MKKFGFVTTLAVAMAAMTAHAQYLEQNINFSHGQNIQTFNFGSNYVQTCLVIPADNQPAMTLAAVPEPTPYLMFGLGALVLAFGRWRASRSRGTRQ